MRRISVSKKFFKDDEDDAAAAVVAVLLEDEEDVEELKPEPEPKYVPDPEPEQVLKLLQGLGLDHKFLSEVQQKLVPEPSVKNNDASRDACCCACSVASI